MGDTRQPAIPRTEAKLRESQHFLEQIVMTQGSTELFAFNLSAFLSAGRSVTFVLANEVGGGAYQEWFRSWTGALAPKESKLLTFMNQQRVQEVHSSGADLLLAPQELQIWRPPAFAILPGSTERALSAFEAYYVAQPRSRAATAAAGVSTAAGSTEFAAFIATPQLAFNVVEGKAEDAVSVCRDYHSILERLVGDFKEGRA